MSDCYDWMMNLATPILIYHRDEDFRIFLRDMLTKHGFFHVLDTASPSYLMTMEKMEPKKSFLLIEGNVLDNELLNHLKNTDKFLIILQSQDPDTLKLSATFGVNHIVTFPFSSQTLFNKISSMFQ